MSKVLLVGGAGYVGSVLAEELLERGYAVRILDRLFYGAQGLAEIRDRVELIVDDMRNVDPKVLEDVDAVINVGGLSNDPTAEYNPQANHEMNVVAAGRLADLCKLAGVGRYLLASSCSIYDRGVGTDGRDVILTEESEVSPRAAYAKSKFQAERYLLGLADNCFCPVVLRKGTIFGFSRRMRYDLVVNSFVKDALQKGILTLHYGGEMWRPLVNIRDVARAYIACLEADESVVRGEIFNVSLRNFRISELALRVRETLGNIGIRVDIVPDYSYKGVRSYQVSADKLERRLGFRPVVTVEESVATMVEQIRQCGYTDFEDPRYFNIQWMRLLEEAGRVINPDYSLFSSPKREPSPVINIAVESVTESMAGD